MHTTPEALAQSQKPTPLTDNSPVNNQSKPSPLTRLHQFSLPPDDLSKVLIEIAAEGQVSIVVPYELIAGYRSSPILGTMVITDALTKALKHTPFTFLIHHNSSQVTIIQRKPELTEPILGSAATSTTDQLDEIVVTGIRNTVTQSMDLKRNAMGIVDAITAEDIGQFPDTNLAESIQRIPGATISRENGEGSKVTVRGFTGNHNLVTLNGRVVPIISTPVDHINESRAFEFSNVASDNVRRVLIHKTHRADLPEGGIGAVLDIQSYRPLYNGNIDNYFSIKGMHDQSNSAGREITPEVSTLLSLTDAKRWGVSLAATWQERDSSSARAYVSQWNTNAWRASGNNIGTHSTDCATSGGNPSSDYCSVIVSEPSEGQLFSLPNDLHYAIYDSSRKRFNTHLTAQLRPFKPWTITIDYARFENRIDHTVAETLLRLTNNRSYLAFDQRTVKTPTSTIETIFNTQAQATASDIGFAAQQHEQRNRTDMLGLNTVFAFNNDWLLSLDTHASQSSSGPGDAAWGSWQNVRFGANVVGRQEIDWSGDLPVVNITINDELLAGHNAADGTFNASDIGTQVAYSIYSKQEVEVDELRLTAQKKDDNNEIKFGLNLSSITNRTQFSDFYYIMGDWGIRDPSLVPDNYFTPKDFASEFSDFSPSQFKLNGFTASADTLISWAQNQYPDEFANGFQYSDDLSDDRKIDEYSRALFVQYSRRFEQLNWPIEAAFGLRYISTDVNSTARINVPTQIVWLDNGDFEVTYASNKRLEQQNYQYDHWLPNFQFKVAPHNKWVYRLAYSHSLARAEYGEMSPEVTKIDVSGITFGEQTNATAEIGNPRLEPIKSNNLDLSIEWYFANSSYLSIGYFSKHIENFIGIESEDQTIYQLRDASSGPRAEQARHSIETQPDYDGSITDAELFNQIAATENNDFNGFEADSNYYGDNYDILSRTEDPFYTFSTLKPNNNKNARIWGLEYAAQIFFGNTGFGLQANYTSVDGDVGYDSQASPNSRQFALLGLSDSMNIIALYEKNKLQGRLAYNWRDTYLESLNIEPKFVEGYHQLDFMLSYHVNPSLSLSLEGINITGENSYSYGRTDAQLNTLVQLEPRYMLGFKFQF